MKTLGDIFLYNKHLQYTEIGSFVIKQRTSFLGRCHASTLL